MRGRAAALTSFMRMIRVLGWSLCDSSPALASSPPIFFCAHTASMSHVHHLSTTRPQQDDEPKILQSVVRPMMHCGGGYSTRCLSGKELRPSGRSGLELWLRARCHCSVRSCAPTGEQLALIHSSNLEGQITQAAGRSQNEGDFRARRVLYATAHISLVTGLMFASSCRQRVAANGVDVTSRRVEHAGKMR